MKAIDVLEKYWGYTAFRNMQEEIVDAAVENRDVLAILPTGGGKSVCFQVPALMKEGIAIVITPLIALMKDQVQNLNDRGIKALAVHMGMSRGEIETALNNAAYGDFKFLYLSPERLSTPLFRNDDSFRESTSSFRIENSSLSRSSTIFSYDPTGMFRCSSDDTGSGRNASPERLSCSNRPSRRNLRA